MEKRSPEYYATHTVILAENILPKKKMAGVANRHGSLQHEITNGLFAAIVERKNVVLKPEYQNAVYLHGYTCYHPIIGHGTVDTSTIAGLRLEDAMETTGEKITHIYFKTRNREYLSYDERCFKYPMNANFEKYKNSGRSFADFEYLFDEIDDKVPEIQMVDKE
ncbi:MAG: hypothetical protein Q4E47_00550 [Candidatus Saccharibacteria bacterium]|nr:hypothetical protein [Candidatus Saccharibacteria bacterium]